MSSCRVRRWGVGATLVGGAAVAAMMPGIGIRHVDGSIDQTNGWMVTPTGGRANGRLSGLVGATARPQPDHMEELRGHGTTKEQL
jgi:hypothetical protein